MIQGLLEARELDNMLEEAMELLLDDADQRACKMRLQYEQLILQNDLSALDTGGVKMSKTVKYFCTYLAQTD